MALTRRHFCGLSCAALGVGLAGCAVNPATGGRNFMLVSRSQEKQMGKDAYPKLIQEFGGVYSDRRVTAYVESLGRKLAAVTETPGDEFTFTVLDNPIVNAFATPGGYVYISRGLMALAENEAELAGVLGHELGHVVARHSSQRISKATVAGALSGLLGAGQVGQALGGLYLSSFSRDQELEADRLGVRYISRAGYEPGAMTSFLAKMRANSRLQAQGAGRAPEEVDERDIMSTHPRTKQRVLQAMQLAGAQAGQGVIERDSYLQRLDNMLYGDSPDQGYVRDRTFAHPGMAFSFRVPEGFLLQNTADSVYAVSEKKKVLIRFDAAEEPFEGEMSHYISEEWAKERDIRDLTATRLGALPAATAKTYIDTRSERLLARIAAIRFDRKRIFRFMAIAPGEGAGNLPSAFQEIVTSFRKLSRAEVAALRPWRIRISTVKKGDTVWKLSRRMPFAKFHKERFLTLNGMEEGEMLAAGSKVKLVLEE
jgi:predicted Zn-dependent protease